MHRHWLGRILSACLAIWFAVSVGEPSFTDVCPVHGGASVEHGAMDGMLGMAETGSGRADHEHAADHTRSPAGHGHHCGCINCCVGAGATAIGSARLAFVLDVAAYGVRTSPVMAEALPRPAPPHTLPLGTGPPRA